MDSQPSQFRILYRGFLTRTIDLDVLSQHGDVANAIARFAGLLAAFSLMVFLVIVPRYLTTPLPPSALVYARWNDEEFLLSATIAVAGLLAVLSWNAFLPERKDWIVLGALPLSWRMIALAKTVAVVTTIGIGVGAVNAFTGPGFPLAIAEPHVPLPVAAFGWWVTNAAAALFIFCAVAAVQAIASQLLPWRAFLRISSVLQLAALAAVLWWFFASPAFAATILHSAGKGALLPSYWFTGLLHVFIGGRTPALDHLAYIAVRNLGLAVTAALIGGALAWRRNPRRIVESPEIAPSRRRLLLPAFARLFCPKAFERAIFLFTVRTMARSRQHRLLLAIYGGAGLALALTFLRALLSGGDRPRFDVPNLPFLTVGWLVLFAAVIGTRAIFVLPQDAAANWIFRVTEIETPRVYFTAVRRALIVTAAVPVWLAAAGFYLSVWRPADGAGALLLLIPAGMIFIYGSLREFRKVPFTCSWFPRNAQGRMKAVVWGLVLVMFASIVSGIEMWGISRLARLVVLLTILTAIALRTRSRTIETEQGDLQFEGAPDLDFQTLELTGEISRRAEPEAAPPRLPVRPWHFAIALLAAGLIYENASQARDRARFPEVGTSWDIGGRKLNLACDGRGSPAVIFEADSGTTGYTWAPIQREVARFTRACWYDRAGYGWSDPAPFPRHSDRIARDLHALLQKGGIAPPYVLVSAGMGTFHARVFRGYYPDEVRGLVLADPMNEDMTINIHNHIEFFRPFVIGLFETIGAFGGSRLFHDEPDGAPPAYSLQEWKTITNLDAQPKSIATQPKEKPIWINGELARAAGKIASTPLVVLSADRPGPFADEDHELTLRLNRRLAEQSGKGVWLSVDARQNRIRFEKPEAIVSAIAGVWRSNQGIPTAALK
ncbi:MAG TPA: alpha/beta fold hydrolase [Bryobacteraceae bacterium]|jgi:hypothetical protein|nr:alpha/beta fold hydrolase [Bryobacteraceae bacterium]